MKGWGSPKDKRQPPKRVTSVGNILTPTPTPSHIKEDGMDKEYILNQLVQGKWVVRRVKGDGSAPFSVVLTADLVKWRRV